MSTPYDPINLFDAAMRFSRQDKAPIAEYGAMTMITSALHAIAEARNQEAATGVVVGVCAWVARNHRAEVEQALAEAGEAAKNVVVFPGRRRP